MSPAALGTRTRPARGQVDVWLALVPDILGAEDESTTRILDREERRRERALVDPRHRLRYRATHLALRGVLGTYLNRSPAEIVLTREPCPLCGKPHGRPAVVAWPPLHFSMSRAGDLALYAVATDLVGVDVELPRPADTEFLESYLHPTERAAIDLAPAARRAEALLGCWVRKEAYLKGLGTGLAVDLEAIQVGLPARLQRPGEPASTPVGWALADLDIAGAHAAVAVATRPCRVRTRVRVRALTLEVAPRIAAGRSPLLR